ncbi:cytochrome P450 [Jimgerdemannia flammicorona]|uniref:Cytochrome P450 n=1 Tax=Jimgerdemannia flammicorona TaxID=994334 RepID=A0A433Q988_9FUNG|nr:cytochrome P450 [Jimgerdemannia flammicorona]
MSQSQQLILSSVLALGTCYVLMSFMRRLRAAKSNIPLVPYSIPFVGHFIELISHPFEFLSKCREKYGDAFDVYMMGTTLTMVTGQTGYEILKAPEAAMSHELAMDEALNFSWIIGYPMWKYKALNAPYIMPKYTSGLNGMDKLIDSELRDSLKRTFNGTHMMTVPNIEDFLHNIITPTMCNIILGKETCHDPELLSTARHFSSDLSECMGIANLIPFKPLVPYVLDLVDSKIKHHRHVMVTKLIPVIELRRRLETKLGSAYEKPLDLLQRHIDARDSQGKPYPADIIAPKLSVYIFAGVYNLILLVSHIVHFVAADDKVCRQLREEQDRIIATHGEQLTKEAVANMKFLDMVVKETLRLTITPCRICVSFPSNEFSAAHVGANPESFDPWRYRNNPLATTVAADFISFGCGPRACSGRYVAVHVTKATVALLVRGYDMRTATGRRPEPTFSLMECKPGQVEMVLEERI